MGENENIPNTEEPKKEKIIRNVSLEELESLKKKDATEGIPASKVKKEVKPKIDQEGLKPKKSIFEPDPELVRLPSGNKVIKQFLTNKNEIYVKRMSSLEEGLFMKLIGTDDINMINTTIDMVIDNCLKTNISGTDLSLIDKFAVFFKIVDLTYGPLDVELKCKECEDTQIEKINIVKDLETKYIPDSYVYPYEIKLTTYKKSNLIWRVLYPTLSQTQDFIKFNNLNTYLSLTHSLEGTIVDNGTEREVTRDDYEELLNNLNDTDKQKYRDFLKDFGSYGAQMTIERAFCQRRGCSLFEKMQTVEVPIREIFVKIIQI